MASSSSTLGQFLLFFNFADKCSQLDAHAILVTCLMIDQILPEPVSYTTNEERGAASPFSGLWGWPTLVVYLYIFE